MLNVTDRNGHEGKAVVAVVVAGGAGRRLGGDIPKQYRLLGGIPVLVRTLMAFEESSEVQEIILVIPEGDREGFFHDVCAPYDIKKLRDIRPGGATRQDSVNNALAVISDSVEIVAIHDGARPLVTKELIERSIGECRLHGAVAVGVPVMDTIKRVDSNNRIRGTVERDGLWLVQTPQVFRRQLIQEAYEAAFRDGYYGTDDAGLVERIGIPVTMIQGSSDNLKITVEGDLALSEALLVRHREQNGMELK